MIERIDPRIKLAVLAIISWEVALTDDIKKLLLFLPLTLSSTLLYPKKGELFKGVLAASSFVAFIFITQLLFGSREEAVRIALRAEEIIILSVVFLRSSPLHHILYALYYFKLPNKLIQVAFISGRFLFELKKELQNGLKSAYCRGFIPKTDLFTYKTYASLLGTLIVKSYLKSERVYRALLCRGFNGHFPLFKEFKAAAGDYIFLLTYTLYGAFVIWRF
ncbi:energy-coupling factor transporter transmembrane component T family protein [Thermovibrio sp.]